MDKTAIEEALNQFVSNAHPSNASSNAPATVGDINRLIEATTTLVVNILNAPD